MTNDVFTEALKQYEEANPGLNWRAGMREQFVRDMKSELQFTNNGFRTVRGSKINVADYITLSLEHGKYLTIKPSTRSEYHPAFPVRSDGTRSAHKRMTETTFRKWCQLEGIVFMPGMESKIAAIIAENFLPVDTPDGPRFHLISDTPIGSLWSKQGFTLEELLNVTGSERFKDNEASEISRLAHRTELRQKAQSLAEPGTKPAEVEELFQKLSAFEKRSLRVGRTLPPLVRESVMAEFGKYAELNGANRSEAYNRSRLDFEALDNIRPIASMIDQLEAPIEVEPHQF